MTAERCNSIGAVRGMGGDPTRATEPIKARMTGPRAHQLAVQPGTAHAPPDPAPTSPEVLEPVSVPTHNCGGLYDRQGISPEDDPKGPVQHSESRPSPAAVQIRTATLWRSARFSRASSCRVRNSDLAAPRTAQSRLNTAPAVPAEQAGARNVSTGCDSRQPHPR